MVPKGAMAFLLVDSSFIIELTPYNVGCIIILTNESRVINDSNIY